MTLLSLEESTTTQSGKTKKLRRRESNGVLLDKREREHGRVLSF